MLHNKDNSMQVPFSKMKLDWEVTKIHVWMNGITM